jgi:hypothetical protein
MKEAGVSVLAAIALVLVGGCTTIGAGDRRGYCEPQQLRTWRLGDVDRATAATLRPLSEEHATGGAFDFGFYPVKSWFRADDDRVLLCRSNAPLQDASAGEWWVFENMNNRWNVSDSGCWGCILVTS